MDGTYQSNQQYRGMRDAFLFTNEGFRTKVYFDHTGIPTVGKGIALVTWDNDIQKFVPHKRNLGTLSNVLGATSSEYLSLEDFGQRASAAITGTKAPSYLGSKTSSKFWQTARGKALAEEFGAYLPSSWELPSSPAISENAAHDASIRVVDRYESDLNRLLKLNRVDPTTLTEQQRIVLLDALYNGRWNIGGKQAVALIKNGASNKQVADKLYRLGGPTYASRTKRGGKLLDPSWQSPIPLKLKKAIAETTQSKTVPLPRRDPLVFDLDSDGIETVAVGTGVLFGHNGDGIATGTGWVKSDDGLLVRDINANGTIDTGRELFGDRTLLSSGTMAADGFAALRDLDTNADGTIDASDAAFAELKIWRDLNQDGFSQADELMSLADAGIAAINLDAVVKNQAQNGNTIASVGTYTKIDGTTGTTADVNLANDPSIRRFTDIIDIPETVIDLPDMTGSGKVRDLLEAAALSPALADILTRFGNAATRAEQLALLDEMLLAWADTSGMARSLDERDPRYRVEYLSFGNVRRSDHMTGTATAGTVTTAPTNADDPHIDAAYRNLINQWNDKVHILEAFNGSYFFGLPGQPQDGGAAAIGMWVDYSGSTALSGANKGKPGLAISFDQRQLDLLQSAYQSLCEAVYDTLVVQTRLQGYLDNIHEEIVVPEGIETDDVTVILDFSGVTQSFQDKLAADPVNGLTDLIEFNKYTRELLSGTQWDGVAMMEGIGCADGYFSHSGKRRLAA